MTDGDRAGVVLVVEDQPANFLLARASLERCGYSVVGAGDADEARRWLDSSGPTSSSWMLVCRVRMG
ncbi:MAG: hypothetical protein R2849_23515 [Thermomicrobiales bacterium]